MVYIRHGSGWVVACFPWICIQQIQHHHKYPGGQDFALCKCSILSNIMKFTVSWSRSEGGVCALQIQLPIIWYTILPVWWCWWWPLPEQVPSPHCGGHGKMPSSELLHHPVREKSYHHMYTNILTIHYCCLHTLYNTVRLSTYWPRVYIRTNILFYLGSTVPAIATEMMHLTQIRLDHYICWMYFFLMVDICLCCNQTFNYWKMPLLIGNMQWWCTFLEVENISEVAP